MMIRYFIVFLYIAPMLIIPVFYNSTILYISQRLNLFYIFHNDLIQLNDNNNNNL